MVASPDAVDMFSGGIYQHRLVGEDARLEVARGVTFHAHTSACEVGRANLSLRTVKHYQFEMHPRAEAAFQT